MPAHRAWWHCSAKLRRGALAGRFSSRLRGRGLDFEELRNYQHGDDIRYLDWKATKRLGRPQIRVFSEERDRPMILVLDQRMSMFFGSQEKTKSLAAAELAALAAWRAKDVGDRIGAIVFDEERAREIKPRRHSGTVIEILTQIVDINNRLNVNERRPPNRERLNQILQQAARVVRHDAILNVISDMDGWNSETSKIIARIARHNDVLVFLVNDPLEAVLPPGHVINFSDGSLQLEVNTTKETFTEQYRKDHQEAKERLTGTLSRHNIPVVSIDTARPVANQLRKKIGAG